MRWDGVMGALVKYPSGYSSLMMWAGESNEAIGWVHGNRCPRCSLLLHMYPKRLRFVFMECFTTSNLLQESQLCTCLENYTNAMVGCGWRALFTRRGLARRGWMSSERSVAARLCCQ